MTFGKPCGACSRSLRGNVPQGPRRHKRKSAGLCWYYYIIGPGQKNSRSNWPRLTTGQNFTKVNVIIRGVASTRFMHMSRARGPLAWSGPQGLARLWILVLHFPRGTAYRRLDTVTRTGSIDYGVGRTHGRLASGTPAPLWYSRVCSHIVICQSTGELQYQ